MSSIPGDGRTRHGNAKHLSVEGRETLLISIAESITIYIYNIMDSAIDIGDDRKQASTILVLCTTRVYINRYFYSPSSSESGTLRSQG